MTDNLFAAWAEDRALMFDSIRKLASLGTKAAQAEAVYQATKARVALEMKADGEKVTYIEMAIKGQPEVNEAMLKRDCARAEYEAEKEALNVYKLDLRVAEAQIERELRG